MLTTKSLLTTKELADAIGASESSLRRWVDSGDIRMSRTAGGHRRIPLGEAVQFIRKIGATVVRPDLLGLGEPHRSSAHLLGLSDEDQLFESLRAGDRELARGMLASWYVEGTSLPSLFDGPMRGALHRLGELWKHDERGILIEHRATEICIEAIAAIRNLMPAVDQRAPVALGGAPEGDPYQIPSLMAGAILAEAGFRELNFGANTPVALLGGEAVKHGARLVWLSISVAQEAKSLRTSIKNLVTILAQHRIELVLGGRCCAPSMLRGIENLNVIGSMSELDAFARGLRSGVALGG
jgi:excisionase family DNA binding protein